VLGLILLTALMAVGTIGFMLIEEWPILDSLYMTVITLSTVGFREVHGLTPPGQMFTIFLVITGLMTVFYTLTRLGQAIFEGELLDILGRRRMKTTIAELRNHYILCGYGKVGEPVAQGLDKEGLPFCVVEQRTEAEGPLQDRGHLFVLGDATEDHTLEEAGITHASTLLALLASDADNLYLTMAAKDLNPSIRVIARASDEAGEIRLKRAGADDVMSPARIAGQRVLQAAVNPTAVEFMEIVTQREALQLSMADIPVSAGSPLDGSTIAEGGIRGRYGVIIVAVKRPDGMTFNPEPDFRIDAGDILVVLGEDLDIAELQADCA